MGKIAIGAISLWILFTGLMILYTGQAQSFAVAGVFGIGVLYGLVLHLTVGVMTTVRLYRRFWKGISIPKSTGYLLAGLLVGDILCAAWKYIDRRKVAETMERGDQVIAMVEEYKKASGRYPSTLEELASSGTSVPSPALKNSTFHYTVKSDDTFVITFRSIAWLICLKHNNESRWRCDD